MPAEITVKAWFYIKYSIHSTFRIPNAMKRGLTFQKWYPLCYMLSTNSAYNVQNHAFTFCCMIFIRNAIHLYFCTLASADTHASTHLNIFLLLKNVQFLWCAVSFFVFSIIAHLQMQRSEREVLLSVFFVGSLNFKPFEKKLFSFFRVTNKVYTAFQNLTSFNIYLLQYGLFARYAMHVPCSNNGLCAWIVHRVDMSLQNGIYAIKRLVS